MSKKLVTFAMILMALFAFTMVGCSSKEEPAEEVVVEEEVYEDDAALDEAIDEDVDAVDATEDEEVVAK